MGFLGFLICRFVYYLDPFRFKIFISWESLKTKVVPLAAPFDWAMLPNPKTVHVTNDLKNL